LAIEAQLVPIPEFVLSIPGRISSATYELVFLAAQLPPLGVKSYFIEKSSSRMKTTRFINIYEGRSEDITISNDVITKCLILQNLKHPRAYSYRERICLPYIKPMCFVDRPFLKRIEMFFYKILYR